jgi:hypothetical protein
VSPVAEKRLLQAVMAIVLLLPASAVIPSIVGGPSFLGDPPVVPKDLDSHFRYLSGIFLALLLLFASTIPAIERQGTRVRLLAAMVVVGGLCRALSWASVGAPSLGHKLGLVVELAVVPLIILWQARLARRFAA